MLYKQIILFNLLRSISYWFIKDRRVSSIKKNIIVPLAYNFIILS